VAVRWRKATWALALWTALMALWLGLGIVNVADEPREPGMGLSLGYLAGFGIIILIWFVGFVALSLVWLMSRPGESHVLMYGPNGEQKTMTTDQARRLEKHGWTRIPPGRDAVSRQ
jgi:hypothetical protein